MKAKPKVAFLEITQHCNLSCKHCYLTTEKEQKELTTTQWFRIIDKLKNWGITKVVLFGGEPTCILPKQKVITANSMKKIEDVVVDDYVLTHKGNFEKVTRLISDKISQNIIKIRTSYLKNDIFITENHPLLAVRTKTCTLNRYRDGRKSIQCKPSCNRGKFSNIKRNVISRRNCPEFFKQYKPEWIPSKMIKKGYFLLYPKITTTKQLKNIDVTKHLTIKYQVEDEMVYPSTKKVSWKKIKEIRNYDTLNKNIAKKYDINLSVTYDYKKNVNKGNYKSIPRIVPVTKDFMRLCGYYLAEGYCTARNDIRFAFNQNELNYIDDVIKIMKRLFGLNPRVVTTPDKNSSTIIFYSTVLANFFENLFGTGAHKKRIPNVFMVLPVRLQMELFKGLWRGDGNITSDGFGYCSVSENLIEDVKNILMRFDILPSVSFSKSNGREIYRLKVTGECISRLANALDIEHPHAKNRRYCFKSWWSDEKFFYIPIESVEKQQYNGMVYNIEVDNNNSYVTKNAVLHNCRTDFYDILQYSIDNFQLVTVETNGTTASKFNSYDCAVSISFEYPDEEYNDEIRGEGTFDKCMKKMQAIRNPKILRYTIYNDSDPLAMAMLAERLGANSVGVPLKPVGSGIQIRDMIPSGKIMVDYCKDIAMFNAKTRNQHIIEDCQYYIIDPSMHRHAPKFLDRGRICSAGVYRIYIDVFGNVYPCMFLPAVKMGNILKDSKTNIFKNLNIWCDKINNMPAGGKCSNCRYYNICNGGCIALYADKGVKLGISCGIQSS